MARSKKYQEFLLEHNEATHEKMYELLMHAASQLRKKLAIDDLSYRVQLSPIMDSEKYYTHSQLPGS